MPLAEYQVQIRDLVMGPGTFYEITDDFNPFALDARAEQTGSRAWNDGSWSGVEWADEVVVPMRIRVKDPANRTLGRWLELHQQLVAAFRPIREEVADVELRFALGGREYLMRGRPRMVHPNSKTIAGGYSVTQAAFVALDPFIYHGTETVTAAIGLPTFSGGLTIPGSSTLIRDTFSRSVVDGWSSADTGEAWSTSGGAVSDFSVDGAQGLVSLGTVDVSRFTTLGVSLGYTDVQATVAPDQLASGNWIVTRLLGRFQDTSNYYGLQVEFKHNGTIGGVLIKSVGGVIAGVGNTFHLGTYSAGERFGARLQLSGAILRGKIWREADGQPDAWTNEGEDTDLTAAGAVGTENLLLVNNTNTPPVVLSWDDLRSTYETSTGGLTVPFTVDGVINGGFADITNEGTADTGMLWRIDGPVSEPRVTLKREDGTIATLRFDITLTSGQWLDVDTAARTVFLNGTASRRGQSAGEFPLLPPGTHRIEFRAAGDPNPTAALTARFRSAWW